MDCLQEVEIFASGSQSAAAQTDGELQFLRAFIAAQPRAGRWDGEGLRRFLTSAQQALLAERDVVNAHLAATRGSGAGTAEAEAAHDRRNVLAGVSNLIHVLSEGFPSGGEFSPNAGFLANVAAFQNILNAMTATPTTVSVSRWADVVRANGDRITSNHFTLTFAPGVDAEGNTMLLSQRHMQEVFANLFSNANRARSEGPVSVHVTTHQGASDPIEGARRFGTPSARATYFTFSVTDDAGGIPPEIMARLGTEGNTTGGNGIGIPSILRRVGEAGGYVEVELVRGLGNSATGTRFHIHLPAQTTAAPAVVAAPAPVAPVAAPARFRVITVDDNVDTRMSLNMLLPYTLTNVPAAQIGEAGTGAAALREVRGNQRQVVILDVGILGENVLETVRAMRAVNPQVRILLCTGLSREVIVERHPGIEALVSGFFVKPADGTALSRRINELLAEN